MAMTVKNNIKNNQILFCSIDDLVPQDHLVRKLESTIDWRFIYPLVKDLYSSVGRPSIDPVVLFKMVFINFIFGINSMRRTCDEIYVNNAYRWFLGLSLMDEVPNYSTWSQNYIRRYKDSDVFDQIFKHILTQAMNFGFINMESVFGDSTHQKANANKNKYNDVEVELTKKKFEDELLEEINKDRKKHGKKPLETLSKKETIFDEETGEEKEVTKTKHIKQSPVDPESGVFHKGEKQKCYAYSHQTFCDINGFVLTHTTVPGNVHDSVSFYDAYQQLIKEQGKHIKNVCLDAGYANPAICKEIIESGKKPILPYKRPMTKKGFFKKWEYVYDEMYDCYLCPNDKVLKYTTTTKDGYRQFKSNPNDCNQCPLRGKCTESKNMQKVIHRHVWEEYKEEAEEIRHTSLWKEVYPLRKETIERIFADCKEQHGFRFTRVRGLLKNKHQATFIFACHNLKKMANWSWKSQRRKPAFKGSSLRFIEFIKNSIKILKYTNKKMAYL